MTIRVKKNLVYSAIIFFLLSSIHLYGQASKFDSEFSQYINNKEVKPITISNVLFKGVLIKNAASSVYYFPNAFEVFSANTIEGFTISPQLKYTHNLDSIRFLTLNPSVRYGFGNNRFQGDVKTHFFYNPNMKGQLSISGGRSFEQIYGESTLSSLNNTLYTFVFLENYLKAYERTYLDIKHSFAPIKDFLFSLNVNWNHRNPLSNLGRFEQNENYSSNNPINEELPNTSFEEHQAFVLHFHLRWQLGHQLIRKRGNLVSQGKSPSISLSYANALSGVLSSDVSYQKLAATLKDEYTIGKTNGTWLIEIGDFLTKNELTFVDFNHFKGRQTFYGSYNIDQFQLLDYYSMSTAAMYLQAHYEHSFHPLVKSDRIKLKPVIGVHYLYTEFAGHYVEFGFGFEKAFGTWRVDLYNSLLNGVYEKTGFRIGLVLE